MKTVIFAALTLLAVSSPGQPAWPQTPSPPAFGPSAISAGAAGMTPGGADNAPSVSVLMNLMAPSNTHGSGLPVVFPGTPGQVTTDYYFSAPFSLSRSGVISCGGSGFRARAIKLVFAAGVDGVVWETNTTSSDGGFSEAKLQGCAIYSLGAGRATMAAGSGTLTDLSLFDLDGIKAPGFAVGDGVIAAGHDGQSTPTRPVSVPTGSFVGSVSGSSVTLADGATATANGRGYVYRLPAALADTANTRAGSNTVTITGGKTKFQPGDLIWISAFPFGATVYTVSGAAGAQTLTIDNWFQTAPQNASASTTGSHIWRVPAGLRRRQQGFADSDYVYGFPIGLQIACSSGGGLNCTGSYDSANGLEYGIVGRWVSGNNSGASTSHANEFVNFYLADIMEGGTIGTLYSGDSSNSGSRNSATPIIGNCANENFSVFLGMYIDQGFGGWPYCLNGPGTAPFFEQPMAGHPFDAFSQISGTFYQGFSRGTPSSYSFLSQVAPIVISSGTYDRSTGAVSLTTESNHNIRAGQRFTGFSVSGTGDYVQLDGAFTATSDSSGRTLNFKTKTGMALTIAGGYVLPIGTLPCFNLLGPWYTWGFSKDCATPNMFGWQYKNSSDSWDLVLAARSDLFRLTGPNYTGFKGDGFSYPELPRGIILGGANETLFTSTTARPTQAWHARGDYAVNQAPSAGGFAGWIATAAGGSNFNPTSPVALDASGNQWQLNEVVSRGPRPTASGTCAINTPVGGATAGSFKANRACSAGTVILTFSVGAPNGWTCEAHDLTTPANALNETAYTPTGCTLSGSMAASDLVTFSAVGF